MYRLLCTQNFITSNRDVLVENNTVDTELLETFQID